MKTYLYQTKKKKIKTCNFFDFLFLMLGYLSVYGIEISLTYRNFNNNDLFYWFQIVNISVGKHANDCYL